MSNGHGVAGLQGDRAFPFTPDQMNGFPDVKTWAGVPSSERRRHERRPLAVSVAISEVDDLGSPRPACKGMATDISRSGIGLRTRRLVQAGRSIFVALPLADGTKKVLYGLVRHAEYESAGVYRVGVEFEDMPDTDEVRYWLATQSLAEDAAV